MVSERVEMHRVSEATLFRLLLVALLDDRRFIFIFAIGKSDVS